MKTPLAAAVVALLASVPSVAAAPQFQTPAPVALLQDLSTGAILFSRDADRRMPPASMAKMMTVYVAFDLIKRGELKLGDMVTVNPETWRKWHGPAAGSTTPWISSRPCAGCWTPAWRWTPSSASTT